MRRSNTPILTCKGSSYASAARYNVNVLVHQNRSRHADSESSVAPIIGGRRGERPGPRGSRVAALALERQYVLPKVIGQLDYGERRARRHHAQ